jgi:hypothetical protein
VCVCLSPYIHMRIGRLVLSSPHHHRHSFAHPPSPQTPHPRVSRKLRLLETCVEMLTSRRVNAEPPPPPPDHMYFVFERVRRRKAEFPPCDHTFAHEMSSGRPQCDSFRCVAYFDTSRGIPTYFPCPRGTEGDRSMPQCRQWPCSSIFRYF